MIVNCFSVKFFFSFPRVHFALFTLPFPLLYHQLKIHEKKKTDPVRCLWDFKVYILKAQFDILFIILHLFGHNYRDGPWLFALKSKLTFLTYIYIKKNLTAPNLLKAPGGAGASCCHCRNNDWINTSGHCGFMKR